MPLQTTQRWTQHSNLKFVFQAQCVQLYVVEVRSQQWLYGRLGHEYTSGSIQMRLIDQDYLFVLANSGQTSGTLF